MNDLPKSTLKKYFVEKYTGWYLTKHKVLDLGEEYDPGDNKPVQKNKPDQYSIANEKEKIKTETEFATEDIDENDDLEDDNQDDNQDKLKGA